MNAKKRMYLGVMVASAGWSGLAAAATATAYGPICDTAARAETMYACSSSSYTAVLISNGTCSEWPHRGMLAGSYYYKYYGGCANTCVVSDTSCNNGMGNHYIVLGSNGWDFRQRFLNANAYTYSRTCDGCTLGLVGGANSYGKPLVHASNTQYGIKKSAWYTGVTTCGGSGYCGTLIGYPTL
jgi:hypothetical protein